MLDGNANQKRKEANLSEEPVNTKYFVIPLGKQDARASKHALCVYVCVRACVRDFNFSLRLFLLNNCVYFTINLEGQQMENGDYYKRLIFNILNIILGKHKRTALRL